MRRNYTLPFIVISLFIFSFLLINKNILAAPENNPVFATIQYVNQKAQDLFNIFNQHEQQNQTDFNLINQRADRLEEENEELKTKLGKLENNIVGAMPDANSPQIGLINFSGNGDEFHFWFTPNTNLLGYVTGHTYRVTYKTSVEAPGDWCGQIPVVNRPPYNLFGNAPGSLVYFKIIDVTTGATPCF